MKLTRRVPARTKTAHVRWFKRDFAPMGPEFRRIRKEIKGSITCWWCSHAFEDGEVMALAAIKGQTNKLLCQDCTNQIADEIDAEKEQSDG